MCGFVGLRCICIHVRIYVYSPDDRPTDNNPTQSITPQNTTAKYGPVVRTKLLGQDWHIVSDPYLAREILITRAGDTGTNADGDFADRFIATPIKGLFGNFGIIFANGQEWAVRA